MAADRPHRILIVDDNEAIHSDMRKILDSSSALEDSMQEAEELLFGSAASTTPARRFQLDSAYQGQEGLAQLERAIAEGCPYSMAFLDVRMPPGWDGIETTVHLWERDPNLQVVLCTAYTDYSWTEITARLGESHNFVILKKPFDNIEVVQLTHALTSKREAMEAARDHLQAVEAEVLQRRQTEAELLAALEAAETANRCKRDFLATMSHELKTPLNAIIGYTEMIEEECRDIGAEALIPSLSKVHIAGRHLLELINDILDMARIESGRMPIQTGWVSASRIADEVLAIAAPLAAKNRNRIGMEVAEEGLCICVDEMRFRQSILNLLSNACKFTSAGEITLEVAKQRDNGRDFVEWRVRDTGIGISEQQIGMLFQPFTQVDSSANRRFGGSGLGLAISQKLCQMMGGHITVESTLGEGSVFTIRVPGCSGLPPERDIP